MLEKCLKNSRQQHRHYMLIFGYNVPAFSMPTPFEPESQFSYLREHSGVGGGVLVVSHPDCPGPVVTPLDHRARLEMVRPQLVDVAVLALVRLRPKAKGHEVLTVAAAQKRNNVPAESLVFGVASAKQSNFGFCCKLLFENGNYRKVSNVLSMPGYPSSYLHKWMYWSSSPTNTVKLPRGSQWSFFLSEFIYSTRALWAFRYLQRKAILFY